jgi:flagellar hook-basal body complex protein FliE
MVPIAPINLPIAAAIEPVAMPGPAPSAPSSEVFQKIFGNAVDTVDNFQSQAGKAIQDLLSGANEDVHTPVIKAQEANLSFQLFMQVRNKVVSAYQTVMGMQL